MRMRVGFVNKNFPFQLSTTSSLRLPFLLSLIIHTAMSSTTTANPVSPTSILFARGVIARLAYWSALRIAVDQGWGGPESAEKRMWFASVIVDAFEEQDPSPDDQYIEEMLLQMMEDEFTANLEDGSAEIVAKDVVRLWEDIHVGKQDLVVRFEQQAEKLKGKTLQVQEEMGSGSESEDDEDGEEDDSDEAPQLTDQGERSAKLEPQIDEDGFTLVQGKGKGRR
jgi:pre-rRNA-processing protein TSR2